MTTYAHVIDGVVRGALFTPPDNHSVQDCFTPDQAAQYVAVPDDADVVEGSTYDGNTFSAAQNGLSAAQLASLKSDLSAAVDAQAERLRLTLITAGTGQAMEYQVAQDEATTALAALAANANATLAAADYPMLNASIGYDTDPDTGKPTTDVAGEARAVDAARKAWLGAGSAIREIRLNGKAAIAAAKTADAVEAAYGAITWPQFG